MKRLLAAAVLFAACTSSEPAPPDAPSTLVNASDVPIDGLSADDVATLPRRRRAVRPAVPSGRRPRPALRPHRVRRVSRRGRARPGLVQKMAVRRRRRRHARPPISRCSPTATRCARASPRARRRRSRRPTIRASRSRCALGPPVLGRGYLEAVADAEIERVEAEQAARGDGIHGRINRVTFASQPEPRSDVRALPAGRRACIGRFGLKARVATLDDFAADALQGDMGITTPMRPTELPNPDGLDRRSRTPASTSIRLTSIAIAFYVRRIAIPHAHGLDRRRRRAVRAAPAARPATCPRCTRAPTIRSRSSPTSTRRSTPTCCSTTWATRSPTA